MLLALLLAAHTWHAAGFTLEVEAVADQAALGRALQQGASAWGAVGAGPAIAVAFGGAADAPVVALDGHNRVGMLADWPYPADAGAVTIPWTNGDEVVEVDIALNPAFPWGTAQYDLANIFTHELGHALGLPDLKDPREATMFYLILPGETLKRDLAHADEANLLKLYEGIDDTAGGCNSTAGTGSMAGAIIVLALLRRTTRRSG